MWCARYRPGLTPKAAPFETGTAQIGRWTSVDSDRCEQDGGQDAALAPACSLHAMNEVPKGTNFLGRYALTGPSAPGLRQLHDPRTDDSEDG